MPDGGVGLIVGLVVGAAVLIWDACERRRKR
jgi:hypothetical protein